MASLPCLQEMTPTAISSQRCKGEFDVTPVMHTGLVSKQEDAGNLSSHPLQSREANWDKELDRKNMQMSRNTQGLHMPMKIGMERFAVRQAGRLPCMATKTSNLMEDTLTGKDELISVEDVFNNPMEFSERGQNPHAAMERRLGLL